MTFICQREVKPLAPGSPQELATWSFASGKAIVRRVEISRPPLATCQAAAAPSAWTGTVDSVDLIEGGRWIYTAKPGIEKTKFAFSGPNKWTGFYTFTWTITGGVGSYRYYTLVGTTYGPNKWVAHVVNLDPSGTTLKVRAFLQATEFGLSAMQYDASVGQISPLCGQDLVPWGFDPKSEFNDPGLVEYTFMPEVGREDGSLVVLTAMPPQT